MQCCLNTENCYYTYTTKCDVRLQFTFHGATELVYIYGREEAIGKKMVSYNLIILNNILIKGKS